MPKFLCVWPCGTWCWKEDIEQYQWMSDDYRIVSVGQYTADETVDVIVQYLI